MILDESESDPSLCSSFFKPFITTRIIYNKGLDCAKLEIRDFVKFHLEINEGETYLTAKSYPLL